MSVIGVDFGTRSNTVCYYDNNEFKILVNNFKNTTTPSSAFLNHKNEWYFGEKAVKLGMKQPRKIISDLKAILGQKFSDIKNQNQFPFKIKEEHDFIKILIDVDKETQEFYLYEIMHLIFSNLFQVTRLNFFSNVSQTVFSIPIIYKENQIKELKKAVENTGFQNVEFKSEPILATIAYLQSLNIEQKMKQTTILLYDLGSSHLDVTIINIENKNYEILNESGDICGKQFDDNIYDYVKKEISLKYCSKVDFLNKIKTQSVLRQKCEEAKIFLSEVNSVDIILEDDDDDEEEDLITLNLTIEKFNELNQNLFEKSMEPVYKILKNHSIENRSIDYLFLVGGSTYMKKIQELISKIKIPCQNVDPREAVAIGATIAGDWILHNEKSGKNIDHLTSTKQLIDILMKSKSRNKKEMCTYQNSIDSLELKSKDNISISNSNNYNFSKEYDNILKSNSSSIFDEDLNSNKHEKNYTNNNSKPKNLNKSKEKNDLLSFNNHTSSEEYYYSEINDFSLLTEKTKDNFKEKNLNNPKIDNFTKQNNLNIYGKYSNSKKYNLPEENLYSKPKTDNFTKQKNSSEYLKYSNSKKYNLPEENNYSRSNNLNKSKIKNDLIISNNHTSSEEYYYSEINDFSLLTEKTKDNFKEKNLNNPKIDNFTKQKNSSKYWKYSNSKNYNLPEENYYSKPKTDNFTKHKNSSEYLKYSNSKKYNLLEENNYSKPKTDNYTKQKNSSECWKYSNSKNCNLLEENYYSKPKTDNFTKHKNSSECWKYSNSKNYNLPKENKYSRSNNLNKSKDKNDLIISNNHTSLKEDYKKQSKNLYQMKNYELLEKEYYNKPTKEKENKNRSKSVSLTKTKEAKKKLSLYNEYNTPQKYHFNIQNNDSLSNKNRNISIYSNDTDYINTRKKKSDKTQYRSPGIYYQQKSDFTKKKNQVQNQKNENPKIMKSKNTSIYTTNQLQACNNLLYDIPDTYLKNISQKQSNKIISTSSSNSDCFTKYIIDSSSDEAYNNLQGGKKVRSSLFF